jgi:hypothetical protein
MPDLIEFLRARLLEEQAEHGSDGVRRWDSPQLLRYAEAGLKILDLHVGHGHSQVSYKQGQHDMFIKVVSALAESFRWHEDYRDEWSLR